MGSLAPYPRSSRNDHRGFELELCHQIDVGIAAISHRTHCLPVFPRHVRSSRAYTDDVAGSFAHGRIPACSLRRVEVAQLRSGGTIGWTPGAFVQHGKKGTRTALRLVVPVRDRAPGGSGDVSPDPLARSAKAGATATSRQARRLGLPTQSESTSMSCLVALVVTPLQVVEHPAAPDSRS